MEYVNEYSGPPEKKNIVQSKEVLERSIKELLKADQFIQIS